MSASSCAARLPGSRIACRPVPAPFRLPAAWLALVAAPAFAAHPLQTEDTGTQGTGQVEIEDGLQRAVTAGASVATWQPQVSVGLAETVDAIVQPSWVSMRAAGTPGECGEGDANLDAKWRFAEGGAWSLAVRAGLELPTAQRGLGLPRGHAGQHALLALTWDAASTLLHLNLRTLLNGSQLTSNLLSSYSGSLLSGLPGCLLGNLLKCLLSGLPSGILNHLSQCILINWWSRGWRNCGLLMLIYIVSNNSGSLGTCGSSPGRHLKGKRNVNLC